MEFQGRVKKLLPIRTGTSQRTGNEWKALPFIFEYYENDTDRYADSVVLETFDEKVIDNLQEGMEIVCGFGHRTRDYEGKVYNELRLYKIESVQKSTKRASQQANEPVGGQSPAPQSNDAQEAENSDDLPF